MLGIPLLARGMAADIVVSQYVRPLWVPKYSVSVIHDFLFVDFPDQFSIFYRLIRKFFFKISARYSSKVITVSKYSQERISQICEIEKHLIDIVPNGILIDKMPPSLPGDCLFNKRSVQLLYVSRLERRKRHEWCIRACIDLFDDGYDVHLKVVGGGDDDYAAHLRGRLANLHTKYPGRFFHLEGISHNKLQDIYSQADIFLFPSIGEGFGIPVIEAAAYGIPCVVSDGTALSELRESYVGRSFEVDNYSDFLKSVRNIIDEIDAYKISAKINIDKVKENYSWETTAKRFITSILGLSH